MTRLSLQPPPQKKWQIIKNKKTQSTQIRQKMVVVKETPPAKIMLLTLEHV